MLSYSIFLKTTITFLLGNLLMAFIPLSGQEIHTPQIHWVAQYSPEGQTSNHRNIFKKISEVVLGKKDLVKLIRPVSILANNPDSFLVLDQGYGALLEITNNNIDVPHRLKREFNQFNSLISMCYTTTKDILFTDSRLNHIYRISSDLKSLRVLNDSLVLQQPTGIIFSEKYHQIWVTETTGHNIRILDQNGNTLKKIGIRGTTPGEFNFPTSLCQDKQGNIYVVDAMNFRIQIFNPEGDYISSFGEAGDANGYFARPKGIATDTLGNIYVVDGLFHTVQVFDKNGVLLTKFGQQGHDKEDLWMPSGIYIDHHNYIYVADTYNSRIQIYQLIVK